MSTPNKEEVRWFLEDGQKLIRFAVFAADKIEANGAYLLARRSQFVGGERFVAGDLKKLKERLETEGSPHAKEFDPVMAVLCESYVRLGFKNNPNLYPKWFAPVVRPLFETQVHFYRALLKARGHNEAYLAGFMTDIKFPGVKAEDIERWELKRGNSNDDIVLVPANHAYAAIEIVRFFGSPEHIHMDTAGLIRRFIPKTKEAEYWHSERLSYLDRGMEPMLAALKKNDVTKRE